MLRRTPWTLPEFTYPIQFTHQQLNLDFPNPWCGPIHQPQTKRKIANMIIYMATSYTKNQLSCRPYIGLQSHGLLLGTYQYFPQTQQTDKSVTPVGPLDSWLWWGSLLEGRRAQELAAARSGEAAVYPGWTLMCWGAVAKSISYGSSPSEKMRPCRASHFAATTPRPS